MMRALSAIGRWAGAGLLWLAARRRQRREARRLVPRPPPARRSARLTAELLMAASVAAAGFIVAYLLDPDTQLLGVGLGLAFAFLSAAAITAGLRLVPQDEREEPLPEKGHAGESGAGAQVLVEGAEGISRRGLIVAAGGAAGLTGAALLLPAASLGPVLRTGILRETPWRPGRRLVDEAGRPLVAADFVVGSFATAFAEGADPGHIDASVMVVRVRPDEVRLPPERAGWALGGILAYSKSCTHAACAVSLFDYPTHPPTSPRPRIVCPCHYSAFDAGGGGDVLFGPAGRPLPQLPLGIAQDGTLVARGDLSGPPGPSWSRVRG